MFIVELNLVFPPRRMLLVSLQVCKFHVSALTRVEGIKGFIRYGTYHDKYHPQKVLTTGLKGLEGAASLGLEQTATLAGVCLV